MVRHFCNSADYLGDDMVMLKEDQRNSDYAI